MWPDAGTFHLAIAACAEGSQGRRAFALLHALPRATGTPPDGEAYSSALVANAKEGNLHAALQIWQIMLVSNTASSSSSGGGGGGASKANGNGNSGSGNGSNGSSLAQQSPSSLTMEPTLECCGALLNLCAARAQWQPALMVIAHLENSGRIPEVIHLKKCSIHRNLVLKDPDPFYVFTPFVHSLSHFFGFSFASYCTLVNIRVSGLHVRGRSGSL